MQSPTQSLTERAHDALRIAESDPTRGAALAKALLAPARRAGDHAAWSLTERTLGVAALHGGDLDHAIGHLRAAIAHARTAGSRQLAGQARMTLAFAASSRGWSRRALREINSALHDLTGHDRARGEAQRGAILHQLGRIDEALACYNRALPVLREADDGPWTWRVLSNRGVLYGHRLDLDLAAADLHSAAELSERLGRRMSGAYVQQNLGWIHTLAGDVPAALHHLDDAERRLRDLGAQLGEVLRDRSELLLSVYLVAEARAAAEAAIDALARERRLNVLPEARLLLARAALLDGDAPVALRQARLAVRETTRQDRRSWRALARLAVLSARLAERDGVGVSVRELADLADTLEAQRWTAAGVEARLAAADLALRRHRTGTAVEQLSRAARPAGTEPVALRAARWQATAMLRLAGGDVAGATRAARNGLRMMDEHHATYGATDLRARAAARRTALAGLGLRIAIESGRARRVLEWAERGRASLLNIRSVRPPHDPVLSTALTALRAAVMEVDELRRAGRDPARPLARQVALERTIRDHCRRQTGGGELTEPVSTEALLDRLGTAALVEFVVFDERILAVTLARGRARLWPLAPVGVVQDALERVPFALHRLARQRTTPASAAAATAMLRDAAVRLDTALLTPLAAELGDAPLILVPSGPLQSVPWSILPGCAGRPVVVAPSATSWHQASTAVPGSSGIVAAVAGPNLPGAEAEADVVAAIHDTKPLVGTAATVDAAMSALNRADLVHLAAHGRLILDNPLFSSLALVDGPLMIYDLERLERVPRTVVLAACDSGKHVVCTGDELLGLAATFLAQGAQQLVASVVPVPDLQTAPLMNALHRSLAAGRSTAEALAEAQQTTASQGPAALAAAAGFVCVGAGLTSG